MVAIHQNPINTLRRFMKPRPAAEQCDLCGQTLGAEHTHLLEQANRRIVCSCDACAILFSDHEAGRFRRVPREIEALYDFQMSDAQWDALALPINLAFFVPIASGGGVLSIYPSPAGATESLLTLDSWQALRVENPVLEWLELDVEALLVNRVGSARRYYRVPIDECYKLVGLIRASWRGLSGAPRSGRRLNGSSRVSTSDRSHNGGRTRARARSELRDRTSRAVAVRRRSTPCVLAPDHHQHRHRRRWRRSG